MHVLVVDDEVALGESVVEYLAAFDVRAVWVGTAEEALRVLAETNVSVILLDINLPGMNGFAFCRAVRQQWSTPIIFITARNSDDDQILALGIGGDDYVTKPFSLAVLLAKVRRVLARTAGEEPAAPDFDDGRLRIDFAAGRTFLDGRELALKAMEHKLLHHLARHSGRVVTKQELFEAVWREPITSDGTLSVHIRRLRTQIEPNPENPRYLHTVWGRGYLFEGRP